MTTETESPKLEYDIVPIRAFKVLEQDQKGRVTAMDIDGRKFQPTGRFWTSLCSTFSSHGLSTKLFKLFTHAEVFQRLTDVLGSDDRARIRYCFENLDPTPGRLLAVTNPNKAVLPYEGLNEVLGRFDAQNIEYHGGIVRSTHAPNHMSNFTIAGDGFAHQYVMETPIDGFGSPFIYLSLMRLVCTNGAIGYAHAFRSEINIGKASEDGNPLFSVERALDSYSNEEGYAALRNRFESATTSWASIMECNRIYKVLHTMAQRNLFKRDPSNGAKAIENLAMRRAVEIGGDGSDKVEGNPVNVELMRAFNALTGDLCSIYGLTHLDALSRKKMQQLPARCKLYDVLNFATEAATHYCTQANGRLLQAEIGNMVCSEFDLEGSAAAGQKENFTDWFNAL